MKVEAVAWCRRTAQKSGERDGQTELEMETKSVRATVQEPLAPVQELCTRAVLGALHADRRGVAFEHLPAESMWS